LAVEILVRTSVLRVLTHYNEMRSNDGFVYQQHALEKQ